ncbi:oligoendopeptidase F [Mycoplasmoides pneumoniae]|uniref:oligoendopeptidase F n=1 Tax=Mycoplasmoides pneumoniae TaxID=2104 RepID=UPI0035BC0B68
MNNQYNWNLEVLLNGKSLADNFTELKQLSEQEKALYDGGACFQTKAKFTEFLQLQEKIEVLENRYSNFLSNKHAENSLDKTINDALFQYEMFKSEHALVFVDFEKNLFKHEKVIRAYLQDPALKQYQRDFELVWRNKKHQIDPASQKLLAQISPAWNQVDKIFNVLSTADLNLQPVVYKGKTYVINAVSDYQSLLENKDRGLREAAYKVWLEIYWPTRNTLSVSLVENYIQLETFAKLKKHPNYIAKTAFDDEIDVAFIDFVYEQVASFAPTFKAFQSLRKQIYKHVLKLDKAQPWDLSVPLFKASGDYTIEQAQTDALKILAPMGSEYLEVVKEAFRERWISWLPDKNKYTGAYSISNVKGLDHYFILMNFDKTRASLNTLVHELGHSVHSWYASKYQTQNLDPTIFYAEIASICNELLLCYHDIINYENRNPQQLIRSLMEQISHFFGATTRQLMFSQFEQDTLKLIQQNQKPDFKTLVEIYGKTAIKYQAANADAITKKLKQTKYQKSLAYITSIPHFYAGNFYVYKYAIGQVVGTLVGKKLSAGDSNMLAAYKRFLSSGSTLPPLETIKLLGIDLTQPEPWQEAHAELKRWIKLVQTAFKQLQHKKR